MYTSLGNSCMGACFLSVHSFSRKCTADDGVLVPLPESSNHFLVPACCTQCKNVVSAGILERLHLQLDSFSASLLEWVGQNSESCIEGNTTNYMDKYKVHTDTMLEVALLYIHDKVHLHHQTVYYKLYLLFGH